MHVPVLPVDLQTCRLADSRSYTSGILPQVPTGPIGLIDTDEFDASGNWQVDV